MARIGLRTSARRKLLAFGGLGALAGLARQPELAHAAHQVEDIGIGLTNPASAPYPTTTTALIANNPAGHAFSATQLRNSQGDALGAFGAHNSASGSGGSGLYGRGGDLDGGSGDDRRGGFGITAFGGDAFMPGAGGRGGTIVGGSSASRPGDGLQGEGGQNTSGALAVGGTGLLGLGGYGGNDVTRTGVGVLGQSTSAEGVRGESYFGPGTLGVSTNYVGMYASSGNHWGLYSHSSSYAGVFQGSVYVSGGLKLLGGFLAAVKHPDGSTRAAHGATTTEPIMEDFGRARLTSGSANVDLEPTFAALVQSADYSVFLTPEGDSRGLYVANRTASGFEVREQQGGASALEFSYRIVAKRRDTDRARLAQLDVLTPLPAVTRTEIPEAPRKPKLRDANPNGSAPSASPPSRR